jgi:predicted DNA-binding transcriptional regulator AlpA
VTSTKISITKHQLAALLDFASKTVERLVDDGKLPKPNRLRPVAWTEKEPLVAALRALPGKQAKIVAQIIENGSHDEIQPRVANAKEVGNAAQQ